MLKRLLSRFHTNRILAFSLIFVAFYSTALIVFATPPTSPYLASDQIINPSCGATDANCYVSPFPDQTGNNGMFLTTDGTSTSWATVVGMGIGNTITSATPGDVLYADGSGDLAQSNTFFWDYTQNFLGIGNNAPTAMLSVGPHSEFQVDGTGAIAAATGIISSGNIQFTALNISKPVFTDASGFLTSAGTLGVSQGGTGITSGTSGGIPYFSSSSTIASSAALAANQIVLGGGAGTTPATLGSLGTTTTVLHGNASGAPTFAAVSLTADVSGTLPVANGGTGLTTFGGTNRVLYTSSTDTLASSSSLLYDGTGLILGTTAGAGGNNVALFRKDANAATYGAIINATSGASANAQMLVSASSTLATYGGIITYSAGVSTSGIIAASTTTFQSNIAMNIGTISSNGVVFYTNNTARAALSNTGTMYFGGNVAGTALVHIAAGTTAASSAPLKFTSGSNMTTAEAGAMEYNGTQLFFSPSTTRNILAEISGSTALTTGSIPFASSTGGYLTEASSSNLFWDSTNGRLSIGNGGTATYKLHVKETSGSFGIVLTDATVSGGFYTATPSGGSLSLGIGTVSNHNLIFTTNNGAPQMTLSTSGYLGIGDQTPLAPLTVGSGDKFQVDASGNLTTASAVTWTLASNAAALNFDANTLDIDATNDRVGIGTATPSYKLHVVTSSNTCGIYQIGGTDQFCIYSGASNTILETLSAHGFGFATNNGSNAMVLDTSNNLAVLGYLGAGSISAPGFYLDINGGTGSATPIAVIKRGAQDAITEDTSMPTDYNNPYLRIGNKEYHTAGYQMIGFGFANSTYQPLYIGAVSTTTTGATKSDFVIGLRNSTTGTVAPTEFFRLTSAGVPSFAGLTSNASSAYVCVSTSTYVLTYNTTACGASSERLKHDIESLDSVTNLSQVLALRPVTYKLNSDNSTQIGFVAEEVASIEPRLLTYEADGTTIHGLNYAQFAPLFAGAIQALDLKVASLESLDTSNDKSLASLVKQYLADTMNGIQNIFAKHIHTDELCVGQTCVTETQLQQLLQSQGINNSNSGGGSTPPGGTPDNDSGTPPSDTNDNTPPPLTDSGDGNTPPPTDTGGTPTP